MLTYIVRRILYSIPVLIISTFLSFMFVSLAGNPTLALKANPRFSQHTVDLISARYHLSDPIPVRPRSAASIAAIAARPPCASSESSSSSGRNPGRTNPGSNRPAGTSSAKARRKS